jgi:large subunit ribosomal protein L21
MFAIVKTGGKQYKVEVGTTFKTELLEAEVGKKVELQTLLISDDKTVNTENQLKIANVVSEVLENGKD